MWQSCSKLIASLAVYKWLTEDIFTMTGAIVQSVSVGCAICDLLFQCDILLLITLNNQSNVLFIDVSASHRNVYQD